MHVVKRTLAAAAAVCAAVVVAVTGSAGSAETLVERGAYLVTTIAACGNCHTPRDASGKPMANMTLAGGFAFDDGPIGHVVVPNITPDPETGIGKWTEAEIASALRNGKRPDGSVIGPPMPIRFYRLLSDRDASAIAAYLRSLKPISHKVGRTQFKNPLPPSWGSPVTHVDAPPEADRIAYGGYLAGPVGHCIGCHTPLGASGPDMSRAYAGGRETPDFGVPGAETVLGLVGFDPVPYDLVVTGEGRVDATTAEGKVPYEVARRCAAAGVRCVVFAGIVTQPLDGVETVALSGDPARAVTDLEELGSRLLDAAG